MLNKNLPGSLAWQIGPYSHYELCYCETRVSNAWAVMQWQAGFSSPEKWYRDESTGSAPPFMLFIFAFGVYTGGTTDRTDRQLKGHSIQASISVWHMTSVSTWYQRAQNNVLLSTWSQRRIILSPAKRLTSLQQELCSVCVFLIKTLAFLSPEGTKSFRFGSWGIISNSKK